MPQTLLSLLLVSFLPTIQKNYFFFMKTFPIPVLGPIYIASSSEQIVRFSVCQRWQVR